MTPQSADSLNGMISEGEQEDEARTPDISQHNGLA